MYRPKTPQSNSYYRLPKQQTLPTLDDLRIAFAEANKRQGVVVELPWGMEGGQSFLLTVKGGKEPVWALLPSAESTAEPLWMHSTVDIELVHNLVFQSVPDDQISALELPSTAGSAREIPSMADKSKASLQGRIENMQMPNLVQSVQMGKMSGRLYLSDQGNNANIYFLDGQPSHASTAEATGDYAILELLSWEQGDFHFFPNETSEERTITRRLEQMIMEGVTLLDQRKFLEQQGLTLESYIVRKDKQITQEEFKSRVAAAAPIDISMQMSFYEAIDNRSRLQDILSRRHLHKVEWIPILFNFMTCGLIEISDSSPLAGKAAGLASTEIDRAVVQGVMRSLIRAETGMFSYPAFLFLLEHEFAKSMSLGLPLSLVVFEIRLLIGDSIQPLPLPALREVSAKLDGLKRSFDILGHYETFDLAFILPGAPLKASRVFANKVASALLNTALVKDSSQRLLLAGGVAGCPEDTQEIGKLISAAREAKNKAKELRVPVKLFAEL